MSSGSASAAPWRWLAGAGLTSLALLPLLPLGSALWQPLSAVERFVEPWFALHCHREPARTLSLFGVPLAVCARCTGIYWGIGLGTLVRRPALSPRALRWAVGVAALVMLADVWLEQRGLHPPWAGLRLLTGLMLAYPVGVGLSASFARAPVSAQRP